MLDCLMAACVEVMTSQDLDLLLSATLKLSNVLDSGTRNGDSRGIRLPSMLKLADVKASDKKTSLLKFILIQLVEKRDIILSTFLRGEMPNLATAAGIQVLFLLTWSESPGVRCTVFV